MTIPASDHNQEYLMLCAWPDGMSRGDVARMLAGVTKYDPGTLRITIGPQAPSAIGSLESGEAQHAAEHVEQMGGSARSVTLEDLAALGPTINVRDLAVSEERFELKLSDDRSVALEFADLQLLVRGRLRIAEKVPVSSRVRLDSLTIANPIRRKALIENAPPQQRESFKTSEKLDLHVSDGRIYQLDGDRFLYGVLGDSKEYSDIANMNKMFDLISHFATQAIVDDFFKIWVAPPGVRRFRIPGMKAYREDTGFAFYSRWAALMYRHVMGE